MPHLIWSPDALRDIDRLYRFLSPRNRPAAQRAVKAIRQSVRLLADHPEAGRAASSMPSPFREWPIGFGADGYVALYRVDKGTVVILAVRHGREGGYLPP